VLNTTGGINEIEPYQCPPEHQEVPPKRVTFNLSWNPLPVTHNEGWTDRYWWVGLFFLWSPRESILDLSVYHLNTKDMTRGKPQMICCMFSYFYKLSQSLARRLVLPQKHWHLYAQVSTIRGMFSVVV
jgi:hypothetical protein